MLIERVGSKVPTADWLMGWSERQTVSYQSLTELICDVLVGS